MDKDTMKELNCIAENEIPDVENFKGSDIDFIVKIIKGIGRRLDQLEYRDPWR